jgi:hypothetical protein
MTNTKMKAWRRTSSIAGVTSNPAAPLVLAIVTDGSDFVEVQFDQPVTWNGINTSNLEIDGDGGAWVVQVDATTIGWQSSFAVNHNPGENWLWDAADPTLSPTPDAAQTGTTT